MQTRLPNLAMPHTRRARTHLAADLRSLARDAEHLLDAATEDLSDKAKETRAQLRGVVEHIRETYGDWQDRSLAAAKTAVTKTDTAVRDHPYQSVGIAFGLGVLVGFLLRRSPRFETADMANGRG